MEEAAQLCDRIGVMDGGRFVVEGSPRDLVRERVGEEVFELRGVDDGEVSEALDGLAVELEQAGDTLFLYCTNGAPVMERLISAGKKDFLRRPATLEDLFLRLTGRELRE
jgi:lipooligosaccharide transport system ATP-binding protein